MSNLFNREKRALNKKLKKERMERILVAARKTFLRFPYFEISMDSIRKIADVPQGRAEMYFGTREDLFLRVVADASKDWADELETVLTAEDDLLEASQITEILIASVQLHTDFFRLRTLLPMVLEKHVEMVSIMTATHGMAAHVHRLAEAIGSRCPKIETAAARRLLLLLSAYGSSLHDAAHEATSMNRLWNDDGTSGFHLDFLGELQMLCETLVAQATQHSS